MTYIVYVYNKVDKDCESFSKIDEYKHAVEFIEEVALKDENFSYGLIYTINGNKKKLKAKFTIADFNHCGYIN